MRVLTRDALALPLLAAALVAAEYVGAPPALPIAVAWFAWLRVLLPRLGAGMALAVVTVAWASVTFIAMSLAPATPLSYPLVLGLAMVLATALARLAKSETAFDEVKLSRSGVAAALSGGVVWVMAVLAAIVVPGGGGTSWAAFGDSSIDLRDMRQIVAYGGVNSVSPPDPRPAEHVLSASFLGVGHPVDSSASTFAMEVDAHTLHWILLVVLASALGGLLVLEHARGVRRARILAPVGAAIVSLGMLSTPISGLMFYRGHINTHVIIVFVLAALHIARRADRLPSLAVAMLIADMTILMLVWTPFAAVPGLLALAVGWNLRAELRATATTSLAWLGAALIFFAWSASTFTTSVLLDLISASGAENEERVSVYTGLQNLVWWPLTFTIVGLVIAGAFAATRSYPKDTRVTVTAVAGLIVGGAPIFIARGGIAGQLEYYPSRYASITTMILAVLACAIAVHTFARSGVAGRSAVTVAAIGVIALSVVAPLDSKVPRWGYAPVQIVTGDYFGTRAQMIDKVKQYPSNEVLRLAWLADSPYDWRVNWMVSVPAPGDPFVWDTPERELVRNYFGDYSTARACALADWSRRPVILMTRARGLSAEVAATCQSDNISVEMLPAID